MDPGQVCAVGWDTACPYAWKCTVTRLATGVQRADVQDQAYVSFFPVDEYKSQYLHAMKRAINYCQFYWYSMTTIWAYLVLSWITLTRLVAKYLEKRCVDAFTSVVEDLHDDDSEDDGGGGWDILVLGAEEEAQGQGPRAGHGGLRRDGGQLGR